MGRVVTGEVCIGLRVAQVVDGHDLNVVPLAALVVGPQNIAPNAAIAIDGNPYGHVMSPVLKRW